MDLLGEGTLVREFLYQAMWNYLLLLRILRWVHNNSAVSCFSLVRWVARKFNVEGGGALYVWRRH